MSKSVHEKAMAQKLKDAGYKFQREFRFCPTRRYRFDFILEPVKTKIAIEISGGGWIKGRHTYGQGYINDTQKYNLAQIMGYMVLTYTPETLPNVIDDLKLLVK